MLTSKEFIQSSLGTHLFFARIMKEHSFFLEIGFTPKDATFTQKANAFRMEFDALLSEAVSLSNGVVSPEVLKSGEVVTPYTLSAEMGSSFYTGVHIQTNITKAEAGLAGGGMADNNPMLLNRVKILNEQAIVLINELILFKSTILTNVLSCKMFTVNYPLLIDHILREAKHYLMMIQMLQKGMNIEENAYEHEEFWNRIMAEHSKFIRGLLDPTENDLINTANDFAKEFDQLTVEAKEAMDRTMPISQVTDDSLKATTQIKSFNEQGTKGLIECKIKSIIIPLLGDHVLRESNHYLRLLKTYKRID